MARSVEAGRARVHVLRPRILSDHINPHEILGFFFETDMAEITRGPPCDHLYPRLGTPPELVVEGAQRPLRSSRIRVQNHTCA